MVVDSVCVEVYFIVRRQAGFAAIVGVLLRRRRSRPCLATSDANM